MNGNGITVKIFSVIVDFLEKLAEALKSSKINKDFYYIPGKVIEKRASITSDELDGFINGNSEGINKIFERYSGQIPFEKIIRKVANEFIDRENYLPSFRSAYSLYFKGTEENKGEETEIIGPEEDYIRIADIGEFIFRAVPVVNPDKLLSIFNWKNFESFIATVLERYGFSTYNNFRFTPSDVDISSLKIPGVIRRKFPPKKRYEIDILALRGKLILAVDAKYRKSKGNNIYSLKRAAEEQIIRVAALVSSEIAVSKFSEIFLRRANTEKIKKLMKTEFEVVPLIVYYDKIGPIVTEFAVPIVGILGFPAFIEQITAGIGDYIKFKMKIKSVQTHL